jgi:hypothetical protein
MMLFRSEEDVDRWSAATGEPRGETVPLQQIWQLSQLWYGNRMDPDFRGRTPDQVVGVFRQAGLTSDFWRT